jgi:hypothetical protein
MAAANRTTPALLSRADFAKGVFDRDGGACVVCGARGATTPLSAHHILERRLWENGGYFLDNGATLCDTRCHLEAEQTLLTPEFLRERAGITRVLLPEDLEEGERYDKWGNPVLPNGTRMRGPLFWEEPVQKVLAQAGVLDLFLPYSKYPRTPHLPWSPGVGTGDRVLKSVEHFVGKRVVVTLKMDGENAIIYRDYYHARSLDSRHHPSRDWLKAFAAQWQYEIPANWSFRGENLYARHSIFYPNLKSYFYLFSIWNERNVRLAWSEIEEWAGLLGLTLVPVLYDGIWDEELIRGLHAPEYEGAPMEGYVVSLHESFPLSHFGRSVAKFVREGHVQTDKHWMHQTVVNATASSRTRLEHGKEV